MKSTSLCHLAIHGSRRFHPAASLLRAAPALPEPLAQHDRQLPGRRPPSRSVPGRPRPTLTDSRRADLEAFLADLLSRRSASTAATRHKAMRILYRWLEEEDEIDQNPMA
jgi:hypothetical protein